MFAFDLLRMLFPHGMRAGIEMAAIGPPAICITLQRHFGGLSKFAHAKSRFSSRSRQEKAVFDVPITLDSTKHVCRNVVVGIKVRDAKRR